MPSLIAERSARDATALFARYRRAPDPATREALVARFLPLAHHLARRYDGGADADDLASDTAHHPISLDQPRHDDGEDLFGTVAAADEPGLRTSRTPPCCRTSSRCCPSANARSCT